MLVKGGHFFTQVSAGGSIRAPRRRPVRAYCWGNNGNGGRDDGSQVTF